ncbi:hypothetical protein [Deinococcus cavernae]|uniref:hypothetical protein n=1 Tax=Deinococcus cavernae TaxID=2320857 RepID=UPI001F3A2B0F|nr:hypothetical protein [Deinococcus cavernae]
MQDTSPGEVRHNKPHDGHGNARRGDVRRGRYILRSLGQADVLLDGRSVVWAARSAEELLWFLHAFPEGRYRHDILSQLWGLEDNTAAANRSGWRCTACARRWSGRTP